MANKRRFTPDQDMEIARLYREGMTMRGVTRHLGIDDTATARSVVRTSLLRSGVTIRPKNSPRPEGDWPVCDCGGRVTYPGLGLCARCYNQLRNQDPAVQERKWLHALNCSGITNEDYLRLLEAQGGTCAICRKPDPRRGYRLAVDHDHSCCPGSKSECGKCNRGLLCVSCNTALGSLHDSSELAEALIAYLTAHQSAP